MPAAGRAVVKEVSSTTGVIAAQDRHRRRGSTIEQLRASDQKEARERLGAEVVTTESETLGDGAFVERRTGNGSSWGSASDDAAEAQLDPRPFQCLADSLLPWTEHGKATRHGPLEVFQPCTSELRYRVIPASGLRPILPLPDALHLQVGPFTFEAVYGAESDGSLTARFLLDLTRGQLAAEEVVRIRAALERIGKNGPRVKFERTSLRLLEAGRGRAALEEIRRLMAAEPDDVGHQLRFALALRRLGLGEAARAAAARAVAMAPANGWAQRVQVSVLETDLVGRRLEPGCDLAGALAAQRRAVELEVERVDTRGYLGTLLLFGEGCRLLGRGAEPAEAVTVLKHSPKILDVNGRADDLMLALLATGRDAEAVEVARQRPQGRKRDAILIAGTALINGSAAAAVEAARLPPGERGETVRAATVHLSRRREYSLAAQVLETATAGSEDVARYQAMSAGLRVTHRLDLYPTDPATPQGAAAAMARAGAGLEPVEGLLARARGEGAPGTALRFALLVVAGVSHEVPPEVVADLAAAQPIRWEPDGADGGQLNFGPVLIYLVKEAGVWKVLAFFGETRQLARRALMLLDQGQPEAARRWLGWASSDSNRDSEWLAEAITPISVGPESSEDALRLLAAALGGVVPGAADAELVLKASLARANSPAARAAILLHLCNVHLEAGRYEAALSAAEAVLRELPGVPFGLGFRLRALGGLGRLDEVRRLTVLAGTDTTLTPRALRQIAHIAADLGAIAEAVALRERLRELVRPSATDLNSLAWEGLYLDLVPATARADAQRAVELAARSSTSELNTLATVLAETGEPEQAMVTLRKEVAAYGAVRDFDWLVIGRIAEAYDLPEVARAAYQRVEPPSRPSALSVWVLARRWMDRLDAAGRKPPAAVVKSTPPR
jgi:tetratricopeptide (TPR) repeat protein